jgi:hypothetical protein
MLVCRVRMWRCIAAGMRWRFINLRITTHGMHAHTIRAEPRRSASHDQSNRSCRPHAARVAIAAAAAAPPIVVPVSSALCCSQVLPELWSQRGRLPAWRQINGSSRRHKPALPNDMRRRLRCHDPQLSSCCSSRYCARRCAVRTVPPDRGHRRRCGRSAPPTTASATR